MSIAYYNEIDEYAAEWLRNLIAAGHIAPGVVDTRSIEDVLPHELAGYTQCHFFAGIGVWSLALRRAGWPDDRPVWTGSCPCQPFSAAGQGVGFADERHLWPSFNHFIGVCRPAVVFGEQVASKNVDPWIDLVQADVEALGYAFGTVPFPSAGVGAPHIRDRAYWVANADNARLEGRQRVQQRADQRTAGPHGVAGGLADGDQHGRGALPFDRGDHTEHHAQPRGSVGGLAYGGRQRRFGREGVPAGGVDDGAHARRIESDDGLIGVSEIGPVARPTGPTNGLWRDADWLLCRDGKFRPVEPGTFPLVDGAPARVGRLRAYGNAINVSAAQVFIEAVLTLPSISPYPRTP